MESHLGTNWIPLAVLFPIVLLTVIGMGWLIAKLQIEKWKRITLGIVGFFAAFGFTVLLLTVYYHSSTEFSDTFRFYAYTALAPEGNPFDGASGNYQPLVMMRDVSAKNGDVEILTSPNPESGTFLYAFVPGKYMYVSLQDNILTIPDFGEGSEPPVIETSLWWALSKNIHELVASASFSE